MDNWLTAALHHICFLHCCIWEHTTDKFGYVQSSVAPTPTNPRFGIWRGRTKPCVSRFLLMRIILSFSFPTNQTFGRSDIMWCFLPPKFFCWLELSGFLALSCLNADLYTRPSGEVPLFYAFRIQELITCYFCYFKLCFIVLFIIILLSLQPF